MFQHIHTDWKTAVVIQILLYLMMFTARPLFIVWFWFVSRLSGWIDTGLDERLGETWQQIDGYMWGWRDGRRNERTDGVADRQPDVSNHWLLFYVIRQYIAPSETLSPTIRLSQAVSKNKTKKKAPQVIYPMYASSFSHIQDQPAYFC